MDNLISKLAKSFKGGVFFWLTATLFVSGFFVFDALALTGITVTSPSGGEYWSGTKNITWTADCGEGEFVDIKYTTGGPSQLIKSSVPCQAGSYSWNTVSFPDNNNYQVIIFNSNNYSINNNSAVFAVDNTAPVITAPGEQTFEATGQVTTPVLAPATATDNIDPTPIITYIPDRDFPVGTTIVTWTATDAAGNYSTAVSNVIIEDTTEPVITLNGSDTINIEYGSVYTELGATAVDIVDGSFPATVGGETVNTSVLGTYTVTYDAVDAASNEAIQVTRTVNVIKKQITVTADAKSKIYGDLDPNLTYTYTPSLVGGDFFSGSLVRTVGENVGTYAITQGTLALTDNYTLTYVGDNLTIGKKVIAVTAEAKSKTYGETDPGLTYTYTPDLITGDSFTGALTRNPGENVGTYTITQGTLALSSNYILNYTGANLIIAKRPLTVKAVSDSKVYDGTQTSTGIPTITSGTLATGDTATWTQTFDNKNAGTGKSLIPDGSVNDGNSGNNYEITFVNDTTGVILALSITASITASDKVYDGAIEADVVCSLSGVIGSDSVVCTESAATFESKNVGTDKTVTATGLTLSGADEGNYTLSNTSASAIADITALSITGSITVNDKVYDGETSATINTRSLSGAIVGDDVSYVGGIATFDNKNVDTGKTVTATGLTLSGADAGNYTVNDTATDLANITARPLTVKAVSDSKVYDGTQTSTGIPTITSGTLATGDTATWTQTFDNKNAGTGKSLIPAGSVNDGNSGNNYAVTFVPDTTGVITDRALTVTADNKSKVYGASDPSLTYQITNGYLVGNDTISGALTREQGENIGIYAIQRGTLTAGSNYNLTYISGILTIQDVTAPVTTDNVPAGWQTGDVIVTLTCNDIIGGNSGCSKVYYTTDGSEPTTSSYFVDASSNWQFTVSDDGEYTVKYRGVDNAGNREDVKTAENTLKLDKTAPVIDNLNLVPVHASVTLDATPEIRVEFIEDGSGINPDNVIIIVDGSDQTDYSEVSIDGVIYTPIIPLAAGTHTVTVNASDFAGNPAIPASWSFIVNPAITTMTVSTDKSSLPANGTNYAKITAQVLDNGSPVQNASVNFATTLGNMSEITVSDENGRATAKLTSTEAGNTTVTASYNANGGIIQGTVNVVFVEVVTDTTLPTAVQWPADGTANMPIDTRPYLNFSEAMNESTLISANIELRKYDTDAAVSSSLVISTNANGTTRVTIAPTVNLNSGTKYYFFIDTGAKDLAENGIAANTWHQAQKDNHEFTTRAVSTSYDINLVSGWNLISLPLIPTSDAIGTVLASINSNVEIVKYYDAAAGVWSSYLPEVGGALTTMKDGRGYWINMKNPAVLAISGVEMPGPAEPLPSYSIAEGWNLLGFKSVVSMKTSEYLLGVDYTLVYDYNGGGYTTVASVNPLEMIDKDLMSGSGYWVYAKTTGSFSPPLR